MADKSPTIKTPSREWWLVETTPSPGPVGSAGSLLGTYLPTSRYLYGVRRTCRVILSLLFAAKLSKQPSKHSPRCFVVGRWFSRGRKSSQSKGYLPLHACLVWQHSSWINNHTPATAKDLRGREILVECPLGATHRLHSINKVHGLRFANIAPRLVAPPVPLGRENQGEGVCLNLQHRSCDRQDNLLLLSQRCDRTVHSYR